MSVIYGKNNAFIHLSYVKKDFINCMKAIDEQLLLSNGKSEYPLYIKALIFRHQGKIEESLKTFQLALGLNPSNVNVLKQIAQSLFLLGKHKTALDIFTEAEELSCEDREIFHYKGMCYFYLKQYTNAIECFETANSIQRHDKTYIQLGKTYRILTKEELALDAYMEALELCPENPDLLTSIGLIYLKLGDTTKAFEYFGNSMTYESKNPKTILATGSIIQDNQDMDVALIKYRVAAHQTPNNPYLWNNIGLCFFGKGKYIASIACLKRSLYLAPTEWIINYNLGLVHMTTEQYASAFLYFSSAINLNSSFSPAYTCLAITLSRLDDFENACVAYEKSLALTDDYITCLNYAITLYKNDEIEKSRIYFQRYQISLKSFRDKHYNNHDALVIDRDILDQADNLNNLLS